ncbi:kinase-like domain-protein [Lipomyces tetrasporus]
MLSVEKSSLVQSSLWSLPDPFMEDLSIYRPCNLLYTEEKLSRYQSGGYHPVCLGDTFKDGRYTIQHKLGWRGFSTVWLANDRKRKQWVAMKIMTADSMSQSQELRNLRSLARHSQGSLDSKCVVQLIDEFLHQGPNGTHQCLVFELLGPSVDVVVSDYHESGDCIEPETILRLSDQLLQAISFIHEVGYAHGDISGRNVIFSCNYLSQLTEEKLFEVLGTPELEELARLDGKPLDTRLPKHLVKTTGWDDWIDEDDEDLRIIDFGEAFLQGAEPTTLAQPGSLKAPETIFTDSFDYRIDLWRAGCVIYSFVFAAIPFQYLGDVDVLVAQMIDFVEKLPSEWQENWNHMQRHPVCVWEPFTRNGQLLQSKLEQKFHERVHEQTLKALLPVIQGLMRFMPSDRISASQALDLIRSKSD